MENIDKMLNCGEPSFGDVMYICTHRGKFKFVPFRCHSRFCPISILVRSIFIQELYKSRTLLIKQKRQRFSPLALIVIDTNPLYIG